MLLSTWELKSSRAATYYSLSHGIFLLWRNAHAGISNFHKTARQVPDCFSKTLVELTLSPLISIYSGCRVETYVKFIIRFKYEVQYKSFFLEAICKHKVLISEIGDIYNLLQPRSTSSSLSGSLMEWQEEQILSFVFPRPSETSYKSKHELKFSLMKINLSWKQEQEQAPTSDSTSPKMVAILWW